MHPILFELPGFTFYTQTLLFIIAFIAGFLVAKNQGIRFAIPPSKLTDIVLWGFLGAILGARVFFLLLHQGYSSLTLAEICTLGSLDGGFSFHGGLVAGGVLGALVTRYHHVNVWRVADALSPGLALAMFFMRLGCLLNGCDYGIVTSVPWGIPLHGSLRHPIQLYEGVGNLLLVPLFLFLNKKSLRPGSTFIFYILFSASLRLGVDFYREDPIKVWGGMTIPQLLAGGMALAAGIIILVSILYDNSGQK